MKQCNADLDPPSDNFLYVLLICFDGTCQCPDTYGIHGNLIGYITYRNSIIGLWTDICSQNFVGKKINATGYEWTPDKAQCLLSDDSECIGLAKTLCASGNCVEGRCFNATKAEIRNHGIKFLGGTTFTMIAVVLCLFLPIFNYLNH